MNNSIEKLKAEHRSIDTGKVDHSSHEMTHKVWRCSCGAGPFIGSGALSEHKRVALRIIRREEKN